jgi:hypothetical protein
MLWTGKREDGSATGFEPRHEQALVIAMLANVSRVLQTVPKALDGTVRPGAAGQEGHGCLTYMTFRHILDPFCIPKMFRPLNWPDEHAVERGAYCYVEVDHIHDLNVHDLNHYLKNPLVHIPIFRSLAGFQSAVTIDEEKQALESFRKFGDLTENVAIEFKGQLESVAPGINDDWQKYREIWDQFFALFE